MVSVGSPWAVLAKVQVPDSVPDGAPADARARAETPGLAEDIEATSGEPLAPGDGAAKEEQERPNNKTHQPKPPPDAHQQEPPQTHHGAPHPGGPLLCTEPPPLGYPTCPLEIEIRRKYSKVSQGRRWPPGG